MVDKTNINLVYEQLTARYDRISMSTIKSVLDRKMKVKAVKVDFLRDKYVQPCLEEAEDAFKKFNCVIFTAFRGCFTLTENLARNARLKADMESLGMTFRPVNGCYREADWDYPCVEYCYFVYDAEKSDNFAFFQKAYQLSSKYDQDSFLYKRSGINKAAFLVATTDAGRADLKGDIKFAGQLYLDVPNVEAWTDCADGRFAFQLRGMVLIGTKNPKIKIGEGSIFDIEGYNPEGIVVLREANEKEFDAPLKQLKDTIPIADHTFTKEGYSEAYIHNVIFAALKKMRDSKCKRIGLHCSVKVNGSSVKGARVAYDTILSWAERYKKNIDWIVVVDTYGDYSKTATRVY